MITPVNPAGAPWPGVSQGVIMRGTGVFVSTGHVGVDASGEIVVSSFEDQVVALYENLDRTLKAAGLAFEHVARITTYVTDYEPALVDTIRKVRSRYLDAERPPASVLVGVAALYDPRVRVEAEVVAVVP
jgi:2-iminobutanoate/2-iminopropanoate deaminase